MYPQQGLPARLQGDARWLITGTGTAAEVLGITEVYELLDFGRPGIHALVRSWRRAWKAAVRERGYVRREEGFEQRIDVLKQLLPYALDAPTSGIDRDYDYWCEESYWAFGPDDIGRQKWLLVTVVGRGLNEVGLDEISVQYGRGEPISMDPASPQVVSTGDLQLLRRAPKAFAQPWLRTSRGAPEDIYYKIETDLTGGHLLS